MVRAILPGEDVEINVGDPGLADHVRTRLLGAGIRDLSRVHLRGIPTNDAWVRDHGGIFVFEETPDGPRRVLLDFIYDAWGGKYPPFDRDQQVAEQMAQVARVPRIAFDLVLEGGGIDGDGAGTILTTESCLLNPNRDRPGHDRSRAGLERLLGEAFGAEKVLWLGDGIEGDDTDGHVDDITRFIGPSTVITAVEEDEHDPNFEPLKQNLDRLHTMRLAGGEPLHVLTLPMPTRIMRDGQRLPASYANFYIANSLVLLPVFNEHNDSWAVSALHEAFPNRRIVPIDCRELIWGLGAFHCLTQQQPAVG
jgi:agmatine deiminase